MKQKFCLIGHPLGHSISPDIHSRLFKISGTDADYRLHDIPPDEFEKSIDFLKSIDGFNVTIPYKQRILPYLDRIDGFAQTCGAVNTVKCENGSLSGYNTDADGFLRALSDAKIELRGHVLLCGAGGAARMMACEALSRGCRLTVATRKPDGAQNCVNDLEHQFPSADLSAKTLSDVSGSFDLILNGTPAGMYPKTEGCPVPEEVIKNSAAVFDAIYNPSETKLLKIARDAGAKTQGGLTMLVFQAAAAQEIWTGARFKDSDMKPLLSDMKLLIEKRYAGKA